MAFKVSQTGQLVLSEESNNDVVSNFDFAKKLTTITGLKKYVRNSRVIKAADGVVALPIGGITTMKGVVIMISGPGTVTFKHDGNTNGLSISQELILFGSIATPTIETGSADDVTVDYMFFGE